MQWRLAEAKNRFSEVINKALSEGPQKITRRDDTVIILSQDDYEKLAGKKPGFKDFLLNQTPKLEDLDLKREKHPCEMLTYEGIARYLCVIRAAQLKLPSKCT